VLSVRGTTVLKQPEGAEVVFVTSQGWRKKRLGENCIMRSFMICADHLVLLVCHGVKDDKMGGACSMFGERRGNIRVLLVKHEGKALL
jgi:hypothetical protein